MGDNNKTKTKEQAERLYKKVNTFILSCVDSDGYPMTKAVIPGKHRESLKELYFTTNTSSREDFIQVTQPKILKSEISGVTNLYSGG